MRWDELFRDLEAQLEAASATELAAEVADRSRREAATLTWVDRAREATGARVSVRVSGAGVVDGVLREVGSQWLLVEEEARRDALVPAAAVLAVGGLTSRSAVPGTAGHVVSRLGLGSALRGLARDRAPVSVSLVDGSVVDGTVDRVGQDFLEVSTHEPGEARRQAQVRSVRTLPFAAVSVVRSRA